MTEVIAAIVGAVVGALAAIAGQVAVHRAERQAKGKELLLNRCAVVAAVEGEFRYRVYHAHNSGATVTESLVPYRDLRLAQAEVRLLAPQEDLSAGLDVLADAGRAMARTFRDRLSSADGEAAFKAASQRHREALQTFMRAAERAVQGK